LARLIRTLVASPATSRRTDLTIGLTRLRRKGRRGLVVVISDFSADESVGIWRQATRRHEVIALRLVEPREEELPAAQLVDLEDAELGTRLVVDTGSARVRAAYAEAASERRAAFRRWCALVGASGLEIVTVNDPIGPLIGYFTGRASRRGGP
jgi:hypothetical protein